MNILVIIDPQIDFIRGSLPVPKAQEAMQYLRQWMIDNADLYQSVYLSMDQHPIDHCSFWSEGGEWPSHCVRYSQGAAIDEGIMCSLQELARQGKQIHYIEKATEREVDCYSAFSGQIPQEILLADRVYISGLAGDYCVRASEEDLLKHISKERIERITKAIAWINEP